MGGNGWALSSRQTRVSSFLAQILVINPRTNATDTAAFGDLGSDRDAWYGAAFSRQTRKIYAMACQSPALLVIHPLTNHTGLIPVPALGDSICKWAGAFEGLDGRIYGFPHHSASVLIFDPATNATDATTLGGFSSQGGKWVFGAVAGRGRVFASPRFSDGLLVIDSLAGQAAVELTGIGSTAVDKYLGCEVVRDTLYCVPYDADNILIVRRECTVLGAAL